MQTVSEVMTRDVQYVSPQETLQRAAQMMDEFNVGSLPVCAGSHLIGIVTDRDITVRGTAAGRVPAEAQVDEVMSTDVRWCFEDEPVDAVLKKMAGTQIRRVPVVSHDQSRRLIGIIALGDLLTKTADASQKRDVSRAAEKISSPSQPDLPQQGSSAGYSAGSEPDVERLENEATSLPPGSSQKNAASP